MCLALEADLRFERLFAYVQDDVTKRRPRVDLALRLLAAPDRIAAARSAFDADASLRRYQLIALRGEANQPTPLLAQYLVIDPRIAAYLLGYDAIDEALRPHAELIASVAGCDCSAQRLDRSTESAGGAAACRPARSGDSTHRPHQHRAAADRAGVGALPVT